MDSEQFNDNIIIQPYDWEEEKEKDYIEDHLCIRIWGLDRNNKPHLLRIENFPYSFYLALPTVIGDTNPFPWNAVNAKNVYDGLHFRLGDNKKYLLPYNQSHFNRLERLYYHKAEKDMKTPMILLLINNADALRHATNIIKKGMEIRHIGMVKGEILETEIGPIRKLISKQKLKYAGWLSAKGEKIPRNERISTLENEYIVNYADLNPIPDEICDGWVSRPKWCAYDIECYSNRHKMFPDEWNVKHVSYLISLIFSRDGAPKSERKRYGLILGDCSDIPAEKISNLEIIKFSDEIELIQIAMGKLLAKEDPDFMTGYNILPFDNRYINGRLERQMEDWPVVGRLLGRKGKVKVDKWSSSAYQNRKNHIIYMPGRISIDVHEQIKRDFKLASYKLDFVAKILLKGEKKHDVSPQQMFVYYENMVAALNLPDDDPKKIKALDDISIVIAYCIQDSELVLDIINKINLGIASYELSNIVQVPISDILIRGQQPRCESMLYAEAYKNNIVLDKREQVDIPFVGGKVQQPIKGVHNNILGFDFQSLYPSIMRAMNICHTTLIHPDIANTIPDEMCNIIEADCTNINDPEKVEGVEESATEDIDSSNCKSKGITGKYTFKFLKEEYKVGLCPTIVKDLCENRTKVRALGGKETDPIKKTMYECRQLGLKVAANSMYGFLGVRNGPKRACLEAAISVTAYGRKMLGIINEYLEKTYGATIIYGDTDSTMVDLNIDDPAKCHELGHKLSKELSDLFPRPIVLEFEKAMKIFTIGKKMYAFFYIDKNGEFMLNNDGIPKIEVKGLMSARRDNCSWARCIYDNCLRMALSEVSFYDVIRYIITCAKELYSKNIDISSLEISKALGSNYKSDSDMMKIFSDNLRAAGKTVQPGDRLSYLVCKHPTEKLLGHRMVLTEMYIQSLETDTPHVLDYNYYLENMLMNKLDKLLITSYKMEIDLMSHISCRRTSRCNYVTLADSVKLISTVMAPNETNKNLDWLEEEIEKHYDTPLKFNID